MNMENSYYFLCMDHNPNPEIVERVLNESVSDILKISDTMYTFASWKHKFSIELCSVNEAIVHRLYEAFEAENALFDCFYISGSLDNTYSLLPEE